VTTTCPGCGLTRSSSALSYDRKFNASAQCWALFEDVISVEFQNPALFGQAHQITVDAYAVQHAGGRHPDKSVCIHLVGLYFAFEKHFSPTAIAPKLQVFASRTKTWPHFDLPAEQAPLTIGDVAKVVGSPEHAGQVRAWGQAVWNSWKIHHAAVSRLASGG
jgi:hypothetical protein